MPGRTEILLEEIRSQNHATIEAVEALGARLHGEMEDLDRRLGGRIDVLSVAVRQNSEGIRGLKVAVGQNTEDIRELKVAVGQNSEAVARIDRKLDRKADTAAVSALEVRVTTLEQRAR